MKNLKITLITILLVILKFNTHCYEGGDNRIPLSFDKIFPEAEIERCLCVLSNIKASIDELKLPDKAQSKNDRILNSIFDSLIELHTIIIAITKKNNIKKEDTIYIQNIISAIKECFIEVLPLNYSGKEKRKPENIHFLFDEAANKLADMIINHN